MDLRAAIFSTPWPHSDRAAFQTADSTLSYRQLFESAERLTRELERQGPANRCLIVLSAANSAAFPMAWLGLAGRGAPTALLSPLCGTSEWAAIEEALGPLPLVASAETADRFGIGGRDRRDLELPGTGSSLSLFLPSAPCRDAPPGVALVKFTSGSTGRPKAISLSAENVLAEAENVRRTFRIEPGDRILAPVPLHHSYGFDLGFLPMLFHGARLTVEKGFIPRRILRRLEDGETDIFLGVPAMYRFLLETTAPDESRRLSSRHLLSCTAPLQPDLITGFHGRFDAVICQHYGSSETGAVANHNPEQVLLRPGSVGRAVHGVTLSVVDEAGRRLPPGVPGEVEVASRAVSGGYLMGGSEPSPFREGSFRMGDQGVLDEDGFLEVLGRLDDLINVGGYKVSPQEVARTLESHPAVREAFVYGTSDRVGGEVVEALVVPIGHPSESELLSHCRDRLADFKVPRRLVFRREIPKGPSGKVTRDGAKGGA